ncbi:MAG: hypothetical protein CMC74_12485 [Flavobacteriaceae bacterium]|nr:hypothetical protein [Flavobacteriaceae bacterium]
MFSAVSFGQEKFPPVVLGEGVFLGETMPLRDAPLIEEGNFDLEDARIIEQDYRVTGRNVVNEPSNFVDNAIQTEPPFREALTLLQNFEGADLPEGQAIPPDPSGAVGPNHYVHAVNVVVKIFDKTGNLLAGPTSLGNFLNSGNNSGDPIVMYDQLEDRFFVSQFRTSDDALIIGVSTTPDPTGTYNLYSFPLDAFPDYPHYSVWPNAYFLTANKFFGNTTYALEKDVMIAGGANPQILGFNLPGVVRNPSTVFSPEPANLLGTAFPVDVPGYIVYLQDSSWSSAIDEDHLKIWELDIDWSGTSTISSPSEIVTEPFDVFIRPFGQGDIEQPITSQRIDAQMGIISYMANYRTFPTYNSFLINFNVDIGGSTSAIRWIELRNTGTGPFSIHQEGTWTLDDGLSRFMGSMAMDEDGNIGLAYNIGNEDTFASLRFTGRLESDPLGMMTYPESTIFDGVSYQANTNRFGDYAQLTLDPNGRTFWHTGQYFQAINNWATRIAAFQIVSDFAADLGAYSFVTPDLTPPYSNAETVEVQIYNYGNTAQSNFDLELRVNGNLVATETFTGTLDANTSASYQFSQTVDMSAPNETYELEVRTILPGDEAPANDAVVKEFTNEILSVNETTFENARLLAYPKEGKTYEIYLSTYVDFGDVDYRVLNIVGQEIASGSMDKVGNGYKTKTTLHTASAGVYVIELSNGKETLSKKLLVR